MNDIRVAKLFKNGASQAVRLPADFRFDGDEVFVRRNPATGDVVLSKRRPAEGWDDFYALMRTVDVPPDFMAERPLNVPPADRGIFDEDA